MNVTGKSRNAQKGRYVRRVKTNLYGDNEESPNMSSKSFNQRSDSIKNYTFHSLTNVEALTD